MPAKNVVNGALVGFKVGSQATVDTMLGQGTAANAVHGCFYLTQDSHRLYIGNEDGSLSALNEGIQTVANMDALTTIADTAAASGGIGLKALTGRFYYDTADNILCVYNGQNWVQLNADTDTRINQHDYALSASNNVATVSDNISLVNKAGASEGTKNASFTVTGDNGITITATGTAMTIAGDTYTLGTADGVAGAVEVQLNSTNTSNDSSFTLSPGANVQLSRDNNGDVSIAATDTVISTVVGSNEATGFRFTVNTMANGASAGSPSGTIDPKISVKNANGTDTTAVSFVNGTASLDVYSRQAVDEKLIAVNAMTYKGTCGTDGTGAASITSSGSGNNMVTTVTAPGGGTANVAIGDTFLMLEGGVYGGQSYQAGSLFIARSKTGEENSSGYIDANNIIFDVVEERSAVDTTYSLVSVTNGVKLHANTGSSGDVGQFIVTAGSGNDWIETTDTDGGLAGNITKTVTITHKDVDRTDTTGTAVTQIASNGIKSTVTIPIITDVVSDDKGHITGIETTEYTLLDTNVTMDSVSVASDAYSVSGSNAYSAGSIRTTVQVKQSDNATSNQTGEFVLSSSSLTIADEDSRIGRTGGSAASGLKIDMVWGSF